MHNSEVLVVVQCLVIPHNSFATYFHGFCEGFWTTKKCFSLQVFSLLVVVRGAIVIGKNGQFDNAYDNKLTRVGLFTKGKRWHSAHSLKDNGLSKRVN